MRQTKRRPIPVGTVLQMEFLEPMGIKVKDLAEAVGVNRNTISRLINNQQVLTDQMAIKLGVALGTSAEFWLNIQHKTQIWDVRNQDQTEIIKDVTPLCADAS